MDEHLQKAVDDLQARFGASLHEYAGDVTLTLNPDQIVDACRLLRDGHGFDMLIDETAVDYYPEMEPRFHVVYHITNLSKAVIICLRVPVNGVEPHLPTIETVWAGANWYEREVFDMFGIRYDGHSDMRRIVMPADWQGHPLRKDYPLGYEEVQFTFNYDDVQRRKPQPKE